jgi:Sulfotransferase family
MFRPWKTASQTVHARLKPYDESPYSGFFYFNRYLNRVVHQHITCAEFICLPESKLGYLTASFVRNPYDRTYSGFLQLKRDIQQQPVATFPKPWIHELVIKQLEENRIQLQRANFQFDEWLELVDESQIYEIGRNSNFPLHPAHYWTHVAGENFVSFVGRVEHFETDFQDFLLRVGITGPIERINANVSNSIDAATDDLSKYKYASLMSVRSIDKINALFAADFEIFGYLKVKF